MLQVLPSSAYAKATPIMSIEKHGCAFTLPLLSSDNVPRRGPGLVDAVCPEPVSTAARCWPQLYAACVLSDAVVPELNSGHTWKCRHMQDQVLL